jgi:hypothetical protein
VERNNSARQLLCQQQPRQPFRHGIDTAAVRLPQQMLLLLLLEPPLLVLPQGFLRRQRRESVGCSGILVLSRDCLAQYAGPSSNAGSATAWRGSRAGRRRLRGKGGGGPGGGRCCGPCRRASDSARCFRRLFGAEQGHGTGTRGTDS